MIPNNSNSKIEQKTYANNHVDMTPEIREGKYGETIYFYTMIQYAHMMNRERERNMRPKYGNESVFTTPVALTDGKKRSITRD